jgi:hypothetical protein
MGGEEEIKSEAQLNGDEVGTRRQQQGENL